MSRAGKHTAHRASAATRAPRASRRSLVALVALALGLTALAVGASVALLLALPANAIAMVDVQALTAARQRYRGPALEGAVLAATSEQITQALTRDPNALAHVLEESRGRLRLLSTTGLGRVQYLTLSLDQLEQSDVAPAEIWTRVADQFRALEATPLAHHLPEFTAAEQDALMQAGLNRRIAAAQARSLVAAHGVFLQQFTALAHRLAAALRRDGALAEADACDRQVRRLLRDLLRIEGPPELRVPVASLLVEQLGAAPELSDIEREVATRCENWRRAAREQLRSAYRPPAALRGSDSGMAVASYDPAWIALTPIWLASAAVGAAPLALAAAIGAIRAGRGQRLLSPPLLLGVLASLLVGAGVVLTNNLAQDLVLHDLTRLSSDHAGIARGPLIWAGVGATFAALSGLLASRRGDLPRAPRIAVAWTAACLTFAAASLVVYPFANATLKRDPLSQRGTAIVPTSDSPEHRALLDALSRWTP